MTAIASYYASVGVGIDPKSLQNVQRYLDTIQAKMVKFQKDAFKTSNLTLRLNNFTVNQASLRRTINTAVANQRIRLDNVAVGNIRISSAALTRQINAAIGASSTASGTGTPIRLRNFHVSQKELMAAINKAVNVEGRTSRIRIGALLSQGSLTEMRNQIRQAINQLVVNPTINPRISQAVQRQAARGFGSSGEGGSRSSRLTTRDPRSMNPWHNPLMIGGFGGALMRYGAFSLPFIAGAYGLNTLNEFAFQTASQRTSLDMVSSMSTVGRTGEDNRAFLRDLAQTIGKPSMGLTPIYTQMLAASTGTELEPQMQEMFSGILQYASVMGLGEESIKRAMVGIQQMIGKRTIMAEELKGQVGEHIPTVIPLMAQAMGMDVKTLFKTMERGELDPMVALPKLAKLMSEMSAPAMANYMKSLPYFQGLTQENRQLWGQRFLAAGGTEGLTRFWEVMQQITKDSMSWTDILGDAFGEIMWRVSNFMLLPAELARWMDGETDIRNFWQKYLGDFEKWGDRFDVLASKIQVVLGGLSSIGESVLDKYIEAFESNSSWQLDFTDRAEANRRARDVLKSRGGAYSYDEFKELSEQFYQSIVSERMASGQSNTQTYLQRLAEAGKKRGSRSGFGGEIVELIMGWGDYSDELIQSSKQEAVNQQNAFRSAIGLPSLPVPSNSIMFSGSVNRSFAHTGGVLPSGVQNVIPTASPYAPIMTGLESQVLSGVGLKDVVSEVVKGLNTELMRRVIENSQPVPDYGPFVTPSANQITPEVRITVTGGITVDGELGTIIDDTNLSEKFNQHLEQVMFGTRAQFSVVHR